eukprot:TRINITY_DN14079_c0_g1_i1.p1 TRINITY_DN14079_c0_g1~~TRINITY_DN14079_c0_g1_i1.p1  ORF type:complete len:150 (+),score=7.15 TRINITY_DN14079_c0_g1_i1:50-499(+)
MSRLFYHAAVLTPLLLRIHLLSSTFRRSISPRWLVWRLVIFCQRQSNTEAETQTVVVTVLQGLATGTLLYVVFFEVIEKERQKGTSGMIQVTFTILGFLCMLVLESVELQLAPMPVTEDVTSCRIDPSFLQDLTLPANVSCINGVLSIV